jgi:sigma-B regulation protein RsbU (phosphoserine phosphatase)
MTRKIHVHGYTCGVLIDALTNPYQRNIVDALNRAAEENHTHLIFLGGRVNSGWENEDRMKYIYTLISPEIVDGLILVSNSLLCDRSVKSAYARTLRPSPAVNIGHVLPGCANIVIDNSSGIRRIVRHLVEEHHAGKIAFIGGVEDNPDAIERHQTFRQTLQELDIPVDPALYYAGDFEQDSGSKAVRHLFAGHADIDTLVVANDHMAIGAMEELRDMGKKVPDDVRITGFDDIPDSCFCIPSLTTAAQPFGRIGRTAIQSMIRQMEKQEVPEKPSCRWR